MSPRQARAEATRQSIIEAAVDLFGELIKATFGFVALTESDDIVRVGYQLRQAMRQVSPAGPKSFGEAHVVFASAIRRAVADGHARSGINAGEAAATLFAALVGCRLLADALGDNLIDRLAQAWRTLLRSIAPEDAFAGLRRYLRTTARAHQQSG